MLTTCFCVNCICSGIHVCPHVCMCIYTCIYICINEGLYVSSCSHSVYVCFIPLLDDCNIRLSDWNFDTDLRICLLSTINSMKSIACRTFFCVQYPKIKASDNRDILIGRPPSEYQVLLSQQGRVIQLKGQDSRSQARQSCWWLNSYCMHWVQAWQPPLSDFYSYPAII